MQGDGPTGGGPRGQREVQPGLPAPPSSPHSPDTLSVPQSPTSSSLETALPRPPSCQLQVAPGAAISTGTEDCFTGRWLPGPSPAPRSFQKRWGVLSAAHPLLPVCTVSWRAVALKGTRSAVKTLWSPASPRTWPSMQSWATFTPTFICGRLPPTPLHVRKDPKGPLMCDVRCTQCPHRRPGTQLPASHPKTPAGRAPRHLPEDGARSPGGAKRGPSAAGGRPLIHSGSQLDPPRPVPPAEFASQTPRPSPRCPGFWGHQPSPDGRGDKWGVRGALSGRLRPSPVWPKSSSTPRLRLENRNSA